MNKLLTVILACLLALGLCFSAYAQDAKSLCGPGMVALDSDKDGAVCINEFVAGNRADPKARERFDALDQNKDGVLDEADRKAILKKLDKNKDGRLSFEEFKAGEKDKKLAESEWEALDRNRDGEVDDSEMSDLWPGVKIFSF